MNKAPKISNWSHHDVSSCRLGIATIYLFTKFKVSTFIHYEDIKAMQNAETVVFFWGGRRGRAVRGHPRSLAA